MASINNIRFVIQKAPVRESISAENINPDVNSSSRSVCEV